MAWENIENRLQTALTVKVSFPAGTIWLPDSHLTIDDWLTSTAQTDEELKELNMIRRIRFLQNRWPVEKLVELEWDDEFANKRVIVAVNIGQRAYILFSDWTDYEVIAAVEPKDKPSLYKAVIGKLLETESFVPGQPAKIRNLRPDLLQDWIPMALPKKSAKEAKTIILSAPLKPAQRWKSFLSDVLEGWIQRWLSLPETGFWHEDTPESISSTRQEQKRAS